MFLKKAKESSNVAKTVLLLKTFRELHPGISFK